jgi:1,2-phenylacetyl-CoA epoxidase PaaB subunit
MAQLSIQFIYRYKPLVCLAALKGDILMRIADDQNVHKVKDINRWATKTSRVKKAHKDEFEDQLTDEIIKRKSKVKTKIKKDQKKEHQALVDEIQELDEEKPNNSNNFSSWA